jgi:hypothetical protein
MPYGRDISCATSLTPGRLVSGARLLAEAAFRRLTTPRGMLRGAEDEGSYGLDLSEIIGSVTIAADAAALPGRIQAELLKDERFESVDVRVVDSSEGAFKAFVIYVEVFTTEGPFTLTLRAEEVSVELLGIEAS